MPRLTGIRITGNKYDGFKKRHEDSIFDLAPEGNGNHTLFTLQNGSGKGVMLQLISQIMLPGTTWGANKGNKIEGMFYNRYNVFRPYTFHVVLEWNLDDISDKKLLAGICITARWLDKSGDYEGKVGLKYFLYTHEYTGESKYSLGNLPLYDKTEGEAIDYDEFESFIDEINYFVKYPKTTASRLNSDYYQYLASHGIYRTEWDIMRTINRNEGGLDKYFSRAKDNQELFDKLIIPAVSESISYRGDDNDSSLLNMFVDNIKIAENLPELISRTEDINRLTNMVEPLLLDAEHGIKLRDRKKSIRSRGNNIYRALDNRKIFLTNELEKSIKEKEKTEEKITKLKFMEHNLKYARKVRKYEDLKDQRKLLREKQSELESSIEHLKDEKKKLRLNQIYLDYKENKEEYRKVKSRIQDLKDSLGFSDLKEKISLVKDRLKKSCSQLENKWKNSSEQFYGYQAYLIEKEQTIKHRKKELGKRIRKLEGRINNFKSQKASLEKWKEELADRFNPLQLSSPVYLKNQIKKSLEQAENKLNEIKKADKKKKKVLEEISEKLQQLQIKLTKKQNQYQNIEETYQERNSREEEIFGQVIKLLGLDKYKEVYSKDWLVEKKSYLKKVLSDKEKRLQYLKNEEKELKQDIALNENDFWIANYDQKRLYEKISHLNIRVYYGSNFLINVAENSEQLVEKYPLLPYSLVIMYEGDWQKIKKNIKYEQLYRSPVPIYINFNLEASNEKNEGRIKDNFKLLQGEECEFIADPAVYQNWYNNLAEKRAEISRTVSTLNNKIENIRQVIYQSDELLKKQSSDELSRKLDEVKANVTDLQNNIEDKRNRIKNLKQEKNEINKRLEVQLEKVDKLRDDLDEIEKFRSEVAELEEKKKEIEKVKETLAELEEELSKTENRRDDNYKLQFEIKNRYDTWKKDQKRFLNELDEYVSEISFGEVRCDEPLTNPPELYDYRDSKVNYYYQQLEDLQKEEEEKNQEIKYLRKDRYRLQNQIIQLEEKMNEIDSDWKTYNYVFKNRDEIKLKLKGKEREIEEIEGKLEEIKAEINSIGGSINTIKVNIEQLSREIKKKYNKSPRSWLDENLDHKDLEIKETLAENNSYLTKLTDMVNDYKEKINQLNSQAHRLEVYQLKPEKGEIYTRIKEEIENNPEEVIDQWHREYQEIKEKLTDLKKEIEKDFNEFKNKITEVINNKILKDRIKDKIIDGFRIDAYKYNYEMLTTFREYLHNELNQIENDKSEAEEARDQWAERSAMHVIRIVNSLKEMINNMVYENENDFSFPLVKLKREDFLPEYEEDIIPELKEYFLELLDKFKEKEKKVDKMSNSELKKYTGDAALFSRAVRGRYPKLQVYKMTEKNEFRRARPRDYFYADWEAVIQGKGDTPEGSGGQSLSINAFMMMMLLNYKKQRLEQSNPWTVMLLDNPFGKASAAHVLDPIFEIADKLNFQIIAFAAPEIIKTEISERFPVFWALEIAGSEKGYGVVDGQVIYGERIRKD